MIYIQYKRAGWIDWCFWPCRDEEEAERVREALREQGYEVRS